MGEAHDENIINEFIVESRDHLDKMEADLLIIEKDGANVSAEIINRVFRAIHSIKGGSSFLGFDALTELSHAMESVLMKFRDGELAPNPVNIDSILSGFDKVAVMIGNIHHCNEIPYDHELSKLKGILQGGKAAEEEQKPGKEKEADLTIVNEFVAECMEGLDSMLPDLLTLKQEMPTVSPAVVKSLCSTMDKIVNGSAFLGFEPLRQLSSAIHNIFLKFKNGNLTFDSEKVDAIVDGVSKLSMLVENILKERDISYVNELIKLNSILEGRVLPEKTEEETNSLFEGDRKRDAQELAGEKADDMPGSHPVREVVIKENKPSGAETLRVSVDLIDRMMNLAGELVLGRNQLRQEVEKAAYRSSKLNNIVQNVDIVTSELQEDIVKMRMQPVGNLLNKLVRIVRDLSRQLSKEANLIIEGKEVELDKTILEGISDPLIHLVRNCMDHGIETPKEREASGKPRAGEIQIKTFHEGGQVNILVKDDGRGIDPDRVAEKAVELGMVSFEKTRTLSDSEKINLILLPGMSTAKEITDISGRGVGMDVVKTNIEKLGGHLDIESIVGIGTSVRIRLPLTLAIISSLVVGASGFRFAIPQVNIQELLSIKSEDIRNRIERIGKSDILRLRENLLPLVSLANVLDLTKMITNPESNQKIANRRRNLSERRQLHELPDTAAEESSDAKHDRRSDAERRKNRYSDIYVVVLKVGENRFGLTVDEFYDNEEIVVKPLSTHIKDAKCFAGSTIMGDGRVAMILDTMGVAEFSKLNFAEASAESARRLAENERLNKLSDHHVSILLFNNAFDEYFAMPLNSISRLELISPSAIYKIGNRNFVDYRSEGLPLFHLETLLPVSPFPEDLNEFYLIIPKTKDHAIGIVVSRIIDTVEAEMNIRHDKTTPRGLLGTAFVEGNLTMFLNTFELLEMIDKETVLS